MKLVNLVSIFPYASVVVGQYAGVRFGPGYDFHVSGSNRIIRAETTYSPGAMEKNITGVSFLWPGIWNPRFRTQGDLIQTVIQGGRSSSLRAKCKAKPGQWCIAPVVMHGVRKADWFRPAVAIDPDAKIRIIYSMTKDGSKWVQTTLDATTGKVLQNMTGGVTKGDAFIKTQFEFSTEMQAGNKGTVSAQTYTNTIITLEKAEPKLTQRQKGNGFKPGVITGFTSEQGGKVWKIAKCQIPAMRPGVATYPATGEEIV